MGGQRALSVTPDVSLAGKYDYLKAFMLQIAVLSNHQNGRDTHIRKIKIFGPREDGHDHAVGQPMGFTTIAMQMHTSVR